MQWNGQMYAGTDDEITIYKFSLQKLIHIKETAIMLCQFSMHILVNFFDIMYHARVLAWLRSYSKMFVYGFHSFL